MKQRRRGIGFVELLAALAMLGVLISVVVQMMAVAAQQRRLLELDRVASESVANVMERATSLAFEELTESKLLELTESQLRLKNFEWSLQVAATQDLPEGKRILLELQRTSLNGRRNASAKLVAWRYKNQ